MNASPAESAPTDENLGPGISLLLVEDDPNLGAVLEEFLQMKGFEVRRAHDGAAGLETFSRGRFDLCIVDVMMPKKDGFTLARDIRAMGSTLPIIFLTARGRVEDKLEGFQAGADDYLTKPFSMEELIARIKAVLRRSAAGTLPEQNEFHFGDFHFDFQHRVLRHEPGGAEQALTSREADLLRLLCQHPNALVRRDLALKQIWGDDSYFNARSMDVFISKLRKYLAPDERIKLMNVHGSGYKLLVP